MTDKYKAWLEKVEGMRNVYNEIPKSDDVEAPTDGVMFPNPLDTLKGKPEPGRVAVREQLLLDAMRSLIRGYDMMERAHMDPRVTTEEFDDLMGRAKAACDHAEALLLDIEERYCHSEYGSANCKWEPGIGCTPKCPECIS